VLAQSCEDVFPGPVQNSTPGGYIRIDYFAKVHGTQSNTLETTSIDDNTILSFSCDSWDCSASGNYVPAINYSGGYPGGADIDAGWGQTINVSPGNYRNLNHDGNGVVSFQPGIYTFSGRITSGTRASFVVSSPGQVVIFAQGSVTFGFQSQVNVPDTDRYLFVYSDDYIRLDNESSANAIFYGNNVYIDYRAALNGAIAAENLAFLDNESDVYFDSDMVANAGYGGACNVTPLEPELIAEWRLDELVWDGSADEVLDNSGNGLHGRAIARNGALPATQYPNPAVAGNPGTCRSGDFRGQSDGYVQIDDEGTGSILDLSSYTVSSWVYPRSYPQGSAIATIVSKDENFEYHLTSRGEVYFWWGDAPPSLTTIATLPLNEWHHVAITNTRGAQAIYIDGVLAASSAVNTAVTVNNDPVLIGIDLGFDARRFDGLIDEVRIYNAAMTAPQINAMIAETHPCAFENFLDHFRIDVGGGSASVCAPTRVTITAEDSNNQVLNDYVGTIVLSTSTSHGNWAETGSSIDSQGVFTATGTDTGGASYAFEQSGLDEGSITLELNNTHAETLTITVADSDAGVTSTSANLTFSENAFVIEEGSNVFGNVLAPEYDVVAGRPHQFAVKMVQRNTSDPGDTYCSVASEYDATSVKVWLTRDANDPGAAAPVLTAGSSVSPPNTPPATANFALPFSNGEAAFTLTAGDVGKYTVNLRDDSSGFSSMPIIGSSPTLIARPFGFDIEVAGNPVATSATGAVFTAAGDAFTATVRAVAWQGADDQDNNGIADGHNDSNAANNADLSDNPSVISYGLEPTPEPVQMSASLVSPVGGNDPGLGAVTAGGNIVGSFSGGEGVISQVYFDEVGIAELSAAVEDGSYIGSAFTHRITGRSGPVGRFIPAYFAPTVTTTSLQPACNMGGYSYMEQPFAVTFTLDARNRQNSLTQNYQADFARFDPAMSLGTQSVTAIDSSTATPLSSRVSIPDVTSTQATWNAGSGEMIIYPQLARDALPDGPYATLSIGFSLSDADGVGLRAADLNLDSSNDSVNDSLLLGQTTVLYGRLRLADAFGPETAPLPVAFVTEFWDGLVWRQNTDDSCTKIALSAIGYPSGSIDTPAYRTVAIGGGTTTGNYQNASGGTVVFDSGDAGQFFSAPGGGNTGSFQVSTNLAAYPWLRFDWNGDGDFSDTALPAATFTFGSYRGHDRIIFWREVLR